jgi:hypothetical protein
MQASARRNRQSRVSPSGVPDVQHLVVAHGWRAGQVVSGGLAGSSTIEADEAIRWQHHPKAEGEGSLAKMKYRRRRPDGVGLKCP